MRAPLVKIVVMPRPPASPGETAHRDLCYIAVMAEKPDNAEPRRRWYQFGLRTLLIAVALLGVGCWYIAGQARIVSERKAIRGELESWTIIVQFDKPGSPPPAVVPQVSRLRRLLGDEAVGVIYLVPDDGRFYRDRESYQYEDAIRKAFPEAEIRYMVSS
jgi:hypothetical protein